MNKIQNIKVLFWDIDNTLLDFDAGAEDSMKQAFADYTREVKEGTFPSAEHTYKIDDTIIEKLY